MELKENCRRECIIVSETCWLYSEKSLSSQYSIYSQKEVPWLNLGDGLLALLPTFSRGEENSVACPYPIEEGRLPDAKTNKQSLIREVP